MEEKYNELDEIRRRIAEDLAESEVKRLNRRSDLIAETHKKLANGEPIVITTEMREYGLDLDINIAAYNYSLNQRILDKLQDEDD